MNGIIILHYKTITFHYKKNSASTPKLKLTHFTTLISGVVICLNNLKKKNVKVCK